MATVINLDPRVMAREVVEIVCKPYIDTIENAIEFVESTVDRVVDTYSNLKAELNESLDEVQSAIEDLNTSIQSIATQAASAPAVAATTAASSTGAVVFTPPTAFTSIASSSVNGVLAAKGQIQGQINACDVTLKSCNRLINKYYLNLIPSFTPVTGTISTIQSGVSGLNSALSAVDIPVIG